MPETIDLLKFSAELYEFFEAANVSKRVQHFLYKAGIKTVGQLEKRLNSGEHIWYIGEKSEQEIRDALTRFHEMKYEPKMARYGQRY